MRTCDMLYGLFVRWSLDLLGVPSRAIQRDYLKPAIMLGRQLRYFPQETAVLIVSQIPEGQRERINRDTIRDWVGKGLVRPEVPDVAGALRMLGWGRVR